MSLTNASFSKKNNSKYASFFACVFAFLLAFCLVPSFAYADVKNSDIILGESVESQGFTVADCPSINALYAYVVAEDGTIYFERSSYSETQIASVTKVMTALVALTYGDPQNTTITVSETAATIGESSAKLQAGDSMNLETALKCLMIVSGNDAAQAIAESMGDQVGNTLKAQGVENVPDKGYDAFVFAMNKMAQDLGMNNSVFINPHGLDDGEHAGNLHSSAHDVSLMCQEAMKNSVFREIVGTHQTTVQVTRDSEQVDVDLESTDELLETYEGACGIKTGFTDLAGACFAGASDRNGSLLYAIVLHSDTEAQRFTDAETLFDWVYNNTISYPLVHSSQSTTYKDSSGNTTTVPVVANVSHKGWVDSTFKATIADPNQSIEVFKLKGNVSQNVQFDDITSDVHFGDKVGTVTFMQHNEVIACVDLVAAEDARGPNFFEGIGVWWDRFFRGFSGEQKEAASTVINQTPLIYGSDSAYQTI